MYDKFIKKSPANLPGSEGKKVLGSYII